ncbi:hypothetical protein DASC09_051280 [Saccharomycopsis crataegensis]|uniref:Mitochondrial carrier protein n=1 Tax=Saccharomycopsis crataegensis TaxID=43959 RepID=A0AAV5QSA8_9ASCO|nr:hypothetical protein DASC09_051280 [Saccharomycopsis crataegensis]
MKDSIFPSIVGINGIYNESSNINMKANDNNSTVSNQNSNQQTISNQNSQVVGAITASIRAFTYQISALYLRTPMKLFRPSRFDYMAFTRLALFYNEKVSELKESHKTAQNPALRSTVQPQKYSFFKHSSIALLVQAVQKHGWRFIPDNVLPPLLANSFTGVVLYTSYLSTLNRYAAQDDSISIRPSGNVIEPRFSDCFRAGLFAGAIQSLVAAPIDAIYTRSSAAELLSQKHENLWKYGIYKLRNIGLIGVFAGYGLSLIKESVGFAFYFSTFELIKNQAFNKTINFIDGVRNFKYYYLGMIFKGEPTSLKESNKTTYKVLKSSFILFGGASAACILQVIQFPLTKIQNIHLSRLEALDYYNLQVPEYKTPHYNSNRYRLITHVEEFPKFLQKPIEGVNRGAFHFKYWTKRITTNPMVSVYYKSYLETLTRILTIQRNKNLTWWQWSYMGFGRNVVSTIPATSVCLLAFEIMRVRLTDGIEERVFS